MKCLWKKSNKELASVYTRKVKSVGKKGSKELKKKVCKNSSKETGKNVLKKRTKELGKKVCKKRNKN